jgi:hypothetical protein
MFVSLSNQNTSFNVRRVIGKVPCAQINFDDYADLDYKFGFTVNRNHTGYLRPSHIVPCRQDSSLWFAKILADCEINNLAAALPPLFCYNS